MLQWEQKKLAAARTKIVYKDADQQEGAKQR